MPSAVFIASIASVCGVSVYVAVGGLMSDPTPATDRAAAMAIATPSADIALHDRRGRWQRAADGLFYIDAMVNGVSIRFLVDTGATVTVLTERDAIRAGVAPVGVPTTIATVGGDAPMRWGAIERIALGKAGMRGVTAAIVSRPQSVSLLGQNVLRQMKTLSIDRDQLTIG